MHLRRRVRQQRDRCFEHFLQLLDVVNDAFNVHSVPISSMRVAIVKRSGLCEVPQRPVGAILLLRIGGYGLSEQLSDWKRKKGIRLTLTEPWGKPKR